MSEQRRNSIDKKTQDSIEALEALLKIRECNERSRSCTTPNSSMTNSSLSSGQEVTTGTSQPAVEGIMNNITATSKTYNNNGNNNNNNLLQQAAAGVTPNLSQFLLNSFPSAVPSGSQSTTTNALAAAVNNVNANNASMNFQLQYPTMTPQQIANVATAAALNLPIFAAAAAAASQPQNQQQQQPQQQQQQQQQQPQHHHSQSQQFNVANIYSNSGMNHPHPHQGLQKNRSPITPLSSSTATTPTATNTAATTNTNTPTTTRQSPTTHNHIRMHNTLAAFAANTFAPIAPSTEKVVKKEIIRKSEKNRG